jgi:hypothetical protein
VEKTQVGPFQILRKLGTSSRHKVYHARQLEQNRDVALKFISIPPTVPRSKSLDKIEREVNALQQLEHPNLIRVYGAGVDEDQVFFATELVDGESLTSLLARRGRLSTDLVIDFGTQIASLLQYLHQKDLVHSKLTPDKILVTADNRIKVADLRLNRARRRRWDAVKRRELEIAAYMAPEQFTEGATAKSDLYSLGVMLFEMLTGRLPYSPDTMGRLNRKKLRSAIPSAAKDVLGCPVWLDKVISQLLDPNPRKRPNSSRAVWMTFREIRHAEAGRKAAVEQVGDSFNPLNAGVDKSEARELLGKTEAGPQVELPFYQQVPFLVTALLSIVAVLAFLSIPVDERETVEAAAQMVASDQSGDWTAAREMLKPVMQGEGDLAEQAEELFYQSRQKTLVRHAELQLDHGLQSRLARDYIAAVQLRNDGKSLEAIREFADLVSACDPRGEERHIHFAAKSDLQSLASEIRLPIQPTQLLALVQQLSSAQSNGDLVAARCLLTEIKRRHEGDQPYREVLSAVQSMLLSIEKKAEGSLDLDAIRNNVESEGMSQ